MVEGWLQFKTACEFQVHFKPIGNYGNCLNNFFIIDFVHSSLIVFNTILNVYIFTSFISQIVSYINFVLLPLTCIIDLNSYEVHFLSLGKRQVQAI